ncbi:hypothetical protein CHGG_09791 [Chaetomium globosum CBS 148.51]|uniref:Uncharacterized protein n=1 Tax=Chaetomium globosum (strain ATCC 6205 / CBS 148.51 / DSM 1962 / NBRC 6347 / NRRL 1970) TaxID=306901 RepID=Q2GQG3_CHAGB|nr:uncharacterized protein CHGG_09791 [Chaetomium globosum CBS 148.51]EAQ83387.1 hypothetical protein CHGG_09791 [Chaetomium globosum CBS 148.51]
MGRRHGPCNQASAKLPGYRRKHGRPPSALAGAGGLEPAPAPPPQQPQGLPTAQMENNVTVIDWAENDPENPLNWSKGRKFARIFPSVFQSMTAQSASFLHCNGLCPRDPAWELSKAKSTLLVQARTGKIGLRGFLFTRRVPEVVTPVCRCGMARETFEHLVLECNGAADKPHPWPDDGAELLEWLDDVEKAAIVVGWVLGLGRLNEFRLAVELENENNEEARGGAEAEWVSPFEEMDPRGSGKAAAESEARRVSTLMGCCTYALLEVRSRAYKGVSQRPTIPDIINNYMYFDKRQNYQGSATSALASIRQRVMPDGLPGYWQAWDFDLGNDTTDVRARRTQRDQLKSIVAAAIDLAIGPDHGWSCEYEGTLKEKLLRVGDNPRKWWGVKIISPPMSASKQWQLEIDMAFTGLSRFFDFYTDDSCGCHVHVSPGPTVQNGYTLDQLIRMAQGAFFWETGLCELLPPKRRTNEHARPNHTVFATNVYQAVPRTGWGRVFNEIESAANGRFPQPDLLKALQGGPNGTRNLSTDFSPIDKIGTIALRRQAGVASAVTTIHRILLAVTLHISALRYDFDSVKDRKDYTTGEELIKELAGCIKKLPESCHGSRFVAFLKWSLESYADGKSYTTPEINAREEALHLRRNPTRPDLPPPRPGLVHSRREEEEESQEVQAAQSARGAKCWHLARDERWRRTDCFTAAPGSVEPATKRERETSPGRRPVARRRQGEAES